MASKTVKLTFLTLLLLFIAWIVAQYKSIPDAFPRENDH